MPQSLVKNITFIFLISLGFLIILFSISVYTYIQYKQSSNLGLQTDEVLINLEGLISKMKDAETGQRGYLLTQKPEFLEPYIGAYNDVIQYYKKLRILTEENDLQQKRLDTLINLINEKFIYTNETIELQKQGKGSIALESVRTGKGKVLMDEIRMVVRRIRAEENKLREKRNIQTAHISNFSLVMLLVSSIISIVFFLLAFTYIIKASKKREMYELELSQLNKRLHSYNEELVSLQESLKKSNMELEDAVAKKETALGETVRQLKISDSDLESFLYSASHDLKAPVSNLEGLLLVIQSELSEETRKRVTTMIEMAHKSINQLEKTIENLSEVSKVDIQMAENMENLEIHTYVEKFKKAYRNELEENKVVLIEKLEVPDLTFSKSAFETILNNLLINAVKYRHPQRQPVITIKSEKTHDFIKLSVSDNGLGIDASQKDKIFKLFKRFHTHVDGTGLGLYLVKKIMDISNGKIEVTSEPGVGSEFTVYFRL